MEVKQQQAFFDLDVPFTKDLVNLYGKIKEEFERTVTEKAYIHWPETFLYNEGWNVFGLRYQGKDFADAHSMCPGLSGFIHQYDSIISSAGFSILNPGTVIKPHVGYTDMVLRCHLGIKIPAGDCALKVDGIERQWKEGGLLIFDDTLLHEAWNKTNDTRIILLLDIFKTGLLY